MAQEQNHLGKWTEILNECAEKEQLENKK